MLVECKRKQSQYKNYIHMKTTYARYVECDNPKEQKKFKRFNRKNIGIKIPLKLT